jgi:hypothetical protein
MPTHPYELFPASANIEHVLLGPDQDSPRLPCLQLYRILCQEFFALEFRKRFRHTSSELQRGLDLFLEAHNRERALRDGSKPGRTPIGLLLKGIGPSKQQDSGSESTLSTASF